MSNTEPLDVTRSLVCSHPTTYFLTILPHASSDTLDGAFRKVPSPKLFHIEPSCTENLIHHVVVVIIIIIVVVVITMSIHLLQITAYKILRTAYITDVVLSLFPKFRNSPCCCIRFVVYLLCAIGRNAHRYIPQICHAH
jgi:hypothetical protein